MAEYQPDIHTTHPNGRTMSPILKYFNYSHLPADMQVVSKAICDIAHAFDSTLPDGAEKSAGLRKLLEAKDCFVRTLVK